MPEMELGGRQDASQKLREDKLGGLPSSCRPLRICLRDVCYPDPRAERGWLSERVWEFAVSKGASRTSSARFVEAHEEVELEEERRPLVFDNFLECTVCVLSDSFAEVLATRDQGSFRYTK